ncbi:type I secretion protein [Ruegeria lacuscaerulensis]|uniref:type I secretion protein n=1 Tax=Ruegeria lacuscaerulensis TaxID=55218 RepID=UPI001480D90D|nr:type I secretion protein [Ruegeria lacuscaerulensis]
MSLDSISETIAHFIGTFELTSEQARWRDQYDEFVAFRRKAELEELEDATVIKVKAGLKLDPGKYDALPFRTDAPQTDIAPAPVQAMSVAAPVPGFGLVPNADDFISDVQLPAISFQTVVLQPQLIPELIGSAVTYTVQTLRLSDNDTLGQAEFRDVETLMAQGDALAAVAESLHAVSAPSLNIADYQSVEHIQALVEEVQQTIEVEGATVHQFQGEDAMGTIVNGEHVDEAPDWSELLPQHHQSDEDQTEDLPEELLPAEWDQSEDSEFGEGHTVSTGGNLAVNEVAVTVAWVDAPVIAVGGQSVNVTVVSQVAVVSDIDTGDAGAQSDTMVVQTSTITVEGNEAHWLDDNVAAEGQDPLVAVTWIAGDLVVTNFIQQEIDATDIDHIETEITASSSLYVMGDNVLINVTEILQLGSYYDVILIGGDMISVDIVHQTIVFLDDDEINGGIPDEDDDNLVVNQVALTTMGEDTHEELDASLAGVLPLEEMDTEALEDALLNNPDFAGMEQIRVLKIDGDLVQVNAIEQITILQDQDDINLNGEAGAVASALGAGNAVLNTAGVVKAGVDSVVMTGEGEYSDLVLHQASLIDTPDDDLDVEIGNDAIAVLIDTVDGPGNSENAPGHNKMTPSEMAESFDDGLQTMLA